MAKSLTIGEFLDALEKNGYPWTTGEFENADGASCAVGQAFRNLGYKFFKDNGNYDNDSDEDAWAFNRAVKELTGIGIIYINDSSSSWEESLSTIKDMLEPYKNVVISY